MITGLSRHGLPVELVPDKTIRVKITDSCGLTCFFCHNEGTPVTADNRRRQQTEFLSNGRSGRSSIYMGSNGAGFLAGTMYPDGDFTDALEALRGLDYDEVHLTGGEPTLHPHLADLIRSSTGLGFTVGMTSNGENGEAVLSECAHAGLDRINLSIFGTTPAELASVQAPKYRSVSLAQRKLSALHSTIYAAELAGVRASANVVIPGPEHLDRAERLLQDFGDKLSIRLLNSLDDGQESIDAIYNFLRRQGAIPTGYKVIAGVSAYREDFVLPNGRPISFKRIRPTRLPSTCNGCEFNNLTSCHEGFYGLRLYRSVSGEYLVGVCIQRMDLCIPVEEFVHSSLAAEVMALRDAELRDPTLMMRNIDIAEGMYVAGR